MTPAAGERRLRFVGDTIRFTLRDESHSAPPSGYRALLRTNLGRAAARRREIIAAHAGRAVVANSSWRDVPMHRTPTGWSLELPLAEVGYFKAKAYLLDGKNWQHWPDGPDAGIAVHPNFTRTASTIYCAFTRLFGATKNLASSENPPLESQLKLLEAQGYATLPPSGKFRDLTRALPHVVNQLGCRIIHLLPVHPTPATYARFGRFGSPYAALDLTAVDPALVEFDKRTTGIDQFCELTRAAHALGARVFIDIVINHTGWGSSLQENHPHFFLKTPAGEFASPGAWGTVWEDLVELEQVDVKLWDLIADSLIIWCRRGVDGFRCDAGYKVPTAAWQYIIARVQEEFPDTIFLLEGLGGSWEATESLLTEGGMQWAYSELFQNYSGRDIAAYLDYANHQNERIGSYVHYSETHDNQRLAAQKGSASPVSGAPPPASPAARHPSLATSSGRAWSLLRNRLCALTSPGGGFGFTCGVEWLATEKIRVHGNTGLNWDSGDNIVPELAQLNRLISDHPCFFDGARLTRLSAPDAPGYALLRESAAGGDSVLVLVNPDLEKENFLALPAAGLKSQIPIFKIDLLGQPPPHSSTSQAETVFTLPPGAVFCLAPAELPAGLSGENYRRARAQAAWALASLNQMIPTETLDGGDWPWLARQVERSPENFLVAAAEFAARDARSPLADLLAETETGNIFSRVVNWALSDARRVTPVPPGHWLLLEDTVPFRATLTVQKTECGPPAARVGPVHVQSFAAGNRHFACFAPRDSAADAELILERYATTSTRIAAAIRFLPATPAAESRTPNPADLALLTNHIGGMARLCVDLGRVTSKYDCALGANLNPAVPVDRHVFAKRIRVWVNADGFLSPLDFKNLASFEAGSPAGWNFAANAGDGRTVEIALHAEMLAGENTTVFHFHRPPAKLAQGKPLPAHADVRLTVRVDIEDRNFHCETRRNGGTDHHFASHCRKIQNGSGFEFTPAADRGLFVFADGGEYHAQPEWCENIPHPVEQTRGQTGSGDAFSPGWFELPLAGGANVALVLTTEAERRPPVRLEKNTAPPQRAKPEVGAPFAARLERSARQFVVRRDKGTTVIAGYPWFLDWGRDSLICARGLLAAGMIDEVRQLLCTFAKFELNGTLPNTIHGNDVSNRDTSDAPLWFAVACEELAALECGDKLPLSMTRPGASPPSAAKSAHSNFYQTVIDESGRTITDVLTSIAENYARGTPNGIRMDADSALIWSPGHFTWMDTNFPAGTPREGYPVEIQALWIRLLRRLEKTGAKAEQKKWRDLAGRATTAFEQLFWLETQGWFADVLLAKPHVCARAATPDDALRSNGLFAVSLGLVTGDRAKRCVRAAQKHLVVPGALRSLAPLPVSVPLPVVRDGQLLNDPLNPYWPRYEGDEDTRRKPAYHNGTAWTWTFPAFCEALARAWNFSPPAVAAAKSYLGSAERLMNEGCLGQLPEILDGDAPHAQRGCDAQAWGATEALRVWKWLNSSAARAK